MLRTFFDRTALCKYICVYVCDDAWLWEMELIRRCRALAATRTLCQYLYAPTIKSNCSRESIIIMHARCALDGIIKPRVLCALLCVNQLKSNVLWCISFYFSCLRFFFITQSVAFETGLYWSKSAKCLRLPPTTSDRLSTLSVSQDVLFH